MFHKWHLGNGYAPTEIASPNQNDVFYNSDSCVWDGQSYPEGCVLQQWQLHMLKQISNPTQKDVFHNSDI